MRVSLGLLWVGMNTCLLQAPLHCLQVSFLGTIRKCLLLTQWPGLTAMGSVAGKWASGGCCHQAAKGNALPQWEGSDEQADGFEDPPS